MAKVYHLSQDYLLLRVST